ncbi:unnamed protein product [Oppiella nova]|uniref:Uncharacterized protein n=1 Tax=Oppiella nova TaxID=334625 RepID=A0A7R9MM05_9ACAR|nr:unnamed protein product [Oppiella nova]CAG2178690.1 unnamed protein product [Oppiella nova]
MTDFTGKFKQTSSENRDALFKVLGFPDDVINRVKIQTSDVEITKDGNNYTIKTVTPYKTWVNTFELGVEFERTRYGIANAKSVVVAVGNQLIETIKGEKEMNIVRKFCDNELLVTITSGPVVSVATYVRQ